MLRALRCTALQVSGGGQGDFGGGTPKPHGTPAVREPITDRDIPGDLRRGHPRAWRTGGPVTCSVPDPFLRPERSNQQR